MVLKREKVTHNKGYVQVYTGDGKGKTTAAIGLAVRALSRGMQVCLIQFFKKEGCSGECALLKKSFKNITIINTGTGHFITNKDVISAEDKSEVENGFNFAKKAINSGEYGLVILDEINVAIDLGIISVYEALHVIKNKPEHVELVLTGRGAANEIIQAADLVTEMKMIKHYYQKGVAARVGIEM